ncbi:metal ABC transporter solute-binding protein, Zn/Mn family [Natronomonas amylolytica]|uniref:metal ABC transporter solute-binding protein, Zn/Mn family n=1 Tax=Natronomonas amylolytica TaxID=3108498 RepID=UPI003009DE3E
MSRTRRSVLRSGVGVLAASAIAGCLDTSTQGDEGVGSGYAAFFTLHEWAEAVSGDLATFEDPVDVGQMGHGWEPTGNITADIAATDAFVYLDSPEFGWAQDVAATLEADYETVAVIDALADLDDRLLRGDHQNDEAHTEDDHGEGAFDPHVWTDPALAKAMVANIADGLAAADPDNEATYRENADSYRSKLDDLDAAFETMVDEVDRETAVLAGHNSFQYLEARYGFELHTPVAISPKAQPSQSDIADTIAFVDDNGIDVVLYDRFESPNLAETIVENSDAEATRAVSPAAGTTPEWNGDGWGYIDQMERLNLPAFRAALGAE